VSRAPLSRRGQCHVVEPADLLGEHRHAEATRGLDHEQVAGAVDHGKDFRAPAG